MAIEREHDRPLSIWFQTKPFREAFRDRLGVGGTATAIAIDLTVKGPCSYSRTARHYDLPARYRNREYTWRKIVGAMDRFDAMGLIDHDRRAPGARGWQSTAQATPELVMITKEIIKAEPLRIVRPGETILLKDGSGNLMDYRDTRRLDRQRRNLAAMNEALSGAGIDPSLAAPVARIYNEGFDRGGRIYAQGPSWQNLKRAARLDVTIAGEPVVELDFKTLHPAMLYAEVGAPLPSDCYDIPPWDRGLVKIAMLTLINAKSVEAARRSIAHKELGHLDLQEALSQADALIAAVKARHRPIAAAFHSDAGAGLMRRDSDMAERVIMRMLEKGVTVLPVHDSFLVQTSKAEDLMEAMMDAACQAGLPSVKVEQKTSA